MKRLNDVENDQVQLEVYECDCGFHIGLDATYTDQVGEISIRCPHCLRLITTFENNSPTPQNERSK